MHYAQYLLDLSEVSEQYANIFRWCKSPLRILRLTCIIMHTLCGLSFPYAPVLLLLLLLLLLGGSPLYVVKICLQWNANDTFISVRLRIPKLGTLDT
jgi:hypothetical protein